MPTLAPDIVRLHPQIPCPNETCYVRLPALRRLSVGSDLGVCPYCAAVLHIEEWGEGKYTLEVLSPSWLCILSSRQWDRIDAQRTQYGLNTSRLLVEIHGETAEPPFFPLPSEETPYQAKRAAWDDWIFSDRVITGFAFLMLLSLALVLGYQFWLTLTGGNTP